MDPPSYIPLHQVHTSGVSTGISSSSSWTSTVHPGTQARASLPSVTSGSAASPALTAIALRRDTARTIFAYAELPTLICYSQVCRTWQSVAYSMPLLKAVIQASLLNDKQLAQLAKALKELAEMRKANDPVSIKNMLTSARRRLRRENCMAVGAPLLEALKSAQIIRSKCSRTRTTVAGDVSISIKLPSFKTATSSSSTKLPAVARATVNVSWVADYQRSTWQIGLEGTSRIREIGPSADALFSMHEVRYDGSTEICDSDYKSEKFVAWMRKRGLMGEGASPEQQCALVCCAISELFDLAGDSPPNEEKYFESCERATRVQPEAAAASIQLPEPVLSLTEQEDERRREEEWRDRRNEMEREQERRREAFRNS